MQPLPPVKTAAAMSRLDDLLLDLLRSLSPDDWQKPTLAPQWQVRDIVAHLLDGSIRGLSLARDGYSGIQPPPISSYQDLVSWLNQLNADWVHAMRRVSPPVLTEWLAQVTPSYTRYLQALDPAAQAIFSVAWAGEETSPNWFHVAREYTEKWHHQQQIRQATGQEGPLFAHELYFPYLDTSMRALPHHYRGVPGVSGELIRVHVTGEGGGTWDLLHNGQAWELVAGCLFTPVAEVWLEGAVTWRIFTKGISRSEAAAHARISGRQELGAHILGLIAVMG
ncbi:MAG: maleylpyruvate isomerase family mycothiol-dependent enzyme [Bacteroidia bacterium]|nr:maleylpyruvate isomerase family mycothiol-dependent enzyme [Bacteroidia bacterium]